MDNQKAREELRSVLEKASSTYRTFSEFEVYVEGLPQGSERDYLVCASVYMRQVLAKGNRFFALDKNLIEEIVCNASSLQS